MMSCSTVQAASLSGPNGLGTLLAAAVIYLVGVLFGAITADRLEAVRGPEMKPLDDALTERQPSG